MKRLFLFSLMLGVYFSQIHATVDDALEDSLDVDREQWIEEQYEHYEDSILNIYFPEPQVVEINQRDSSGINARINSNPPTLGITNNVVPNAVNLDYSRHVGEIPILSGVSPSGAKTYEVPIKLCPGQEDFMPKLSLVYNSQQGNSIVGTGWSLSGLEAITRIPKSIYYDGAAEGILMDNTDGFSLNGIRLLKLEQTNDAILYETETGHIKVKGYYAGDVMKYFEVFYPNGNKGIFGYESNTINRLSYPQMSLTDLRGNTITYIYIPHGQQNYIYSIYYTGGNIEFEYESARVDTLLAYSGGEKIENSHLLKRISSKRILSTLGTYTLSYDTIYERSLLSRIDYEAGGSSLNPLRFYYGEGQNIYSYNRTDSHLPKYYLMPTLGSINATFGRSEYLNGNDALIVWPNKVAFYDRNVSGKHIYRNKYTGSENIFIYSNLHATYASVDSLKTGDGFVEVICADLTGSQQEDIIRVRNIQASGQDSVHFDVYRLSSYGQLLLRYSRQFSVGAAYNGPSGNKSVHPKTFHVGDFNGDGKMEILVMCGQPTSSCTYYSPSCHIYDLENNQTLYQGALLPQYEIHFFGDWETDPQTIANGTERIIVCDYDGDGKSDLYHIDTSGTHVYTFQQSYSGLTSVTVNSNAGLYKSRLADSDLLVGDFNGDGLTDLFVTAPFSAPDMTPSLVFNSKGDGSLDRHDSGLLKKNSSYDFGLITQDVNSDGYSDIINYGVGGFDTWITFTNRPRTTHFSAEYPSAGRTKLIPANVSSRNTFTSLMSIKDGIVALYELPLNSSKEAMITGMANSHGVIEKNHYRRANEAGESVIMPAPEAAFNPTYPYIEVHEPILVLDRSELYMNGNIVDFNKYGYGTAVFHRQGLGFRGFTSFTRNDNRNRVYHQSFDVENFSVPVLNITPDKQTDCTYSVNVDNYKRAQIELTEKEVYDQKTGVTATSTYTYGYQSYGNPTSETTTFSGSDISVEKTYGYDHNTTVGDGYYLGYPTSVYTTISDANDAFTEEIYTTHDRCLPLTMTKTADGNIVRRETYTYDSNGNMLTETVMPGFSSDGLTTTYTYNAYGQLASKTDPQGMTCSYVYDDLGRVSSMTNSVGDHDAFTYDALGTLVSSVHGTGSDLVTDTFTYSWSSDAPSALYRVAHEETGKPVTRTYYDALNREVRIGDLRFDGNYRHIDKTYDSYGRLSAVSLPFKGTSASCWSTYSYDSFDRITTLTEASGRMTSHSYNGLSIATTEDGITTTRSYDVLGRLITSTDPAGTVTYNLAADGQPVSITAPGNVTTTFTYNSRRWRTSVTDPSTGTTTFEYHPEGTLYKTTDARNKNTFYYYDLTGRLTETRHPEFAVSYTYNNRNQLTSATATNGVTKEMTYDVHGRLSTWKETVDSVWLQKSYTYSDNNLASITYNSHRGLIASENHSYTNGTLTAINKDGTQPVFQLQQENGLGLPTQVVTQNLTRTYCYTSTGIPTGRTASGIGGTIQDESYNFDVTTSNLLSRTDNIRNLTDQFVFDNLNRLTSCSGVTVQFDTKGNITSKSNVGTFTYDNVQKPYAVTGANASSGTISSNTQDITYNTFPRPRQIAEGDYTLDFTYDGDLDRVKEEVKQNGTTIETRYSLGGCYDYIIGSGANQKEEDLYFAGDYYNAQILLQKYNDGSLYVNHLVRDYQGSIMSLVDPSGYWHSDWSYDAWGRPRNPQTHVVYNPSALTTYSSAYRGYCGHEHLPQFGLINMNARLYDPITSRFLAPDPYVQMPDNTQSFNRYSYCLNNPLKYVDENGEEFAIAAIVGAVIGVYMGGVMANNNYNPLRWDYGSVTTWGYMFCGGLVGAASGYAGAAVSASGIVGANTLGIITASAINSLGTYAYTLGQTPITISAGAFSFDFTNGEFGYLGKKGNSKIENAGYAFGALANLQDAVTLISGGGKNIMINSAGTNKDDWWGHSSITDEDENILVSVGPQSQVQKGESLSQTWKNSIKEANLQWPTHLGEKGTWSVGINGVSTNAISNYVSNVTRWDLLLNSCVGHASRALWKAGIPNLYLFHPHLLNAQLVIRQLGIYSSPYLYNIP